MKARENAHRIAALPSILHGLGFDPRPCLEDWEDVATHRIHWSMRVLAFAGYAPAQAYPFGLFILGPFCPELESDLMEIDWGHVGMEAVVEDQRMLTVKEAIDRGDDFLISLATLLGVVDRNAGINRSDSVELAGEIVEEPVEVVQAAYDFAEEKIWPR